jgi:hypothetical protein
LIAHLKGNLLTITFLLFSLAPLLSQIRYILGAAWLTVLRLKAVVDS